MSTLPSVTCYVKQLSGDIITVSLDHTLGIVKSLELVHPTPKGYKVSLFRDETHEPVMAMDAIVEEERLLVLYSWAHYRYMLESPEHQPTDVVDESGRFHRRWEIWKIPELPGADRVSIWSLSSDDTHCAHDTHRAHDTIVFYRNAETGHIISGDHVHIMETNEFGLPTISIDSENHVYTDFRVFLESKDIPPCDFFKYNTIYW